MGVEVGLVLPQSHSVYPDLGVRVTRIVDVEVSVALET